MAKAMDGTWEPGAGAKEPSGVGGVERSEGCRGNWRGPRWPRACGVREAVPAYNRRGREGAGGHQGVGGVVVPLDGRDNTTRPEGRAPTSSTRDASRRGSVSARMRARSTAKADGLDRSRALQRVLYRSAKQQPHRRFHALFDKVARGDILERAWEEVRSNRGAPGVEV
jgi:hypothetical protein